MDDDSPGTPEEAAYEQAQIDALFEPRSRVPGLFTQKPGDRRHVRDYHHRKRFGPEREAYLLYQRDWMREHRKRKKEERRLAKEAEKGGE